LPNIITQNAEKWKPDSIIRAKSGFVRPELRQLDFIDIGLLPALDHEAGKKIDHILQIVLNHTEEECKKLKIKFDASAIFKVVFSLLAAKLLTDRDIPVSSTIDFTIPQTALQAVRNHYGESLTTASAKLPQSILKYISQEIGRSFSLKNISVDTLTYVYENTFVSPQSRKKLGIHSTPSYLADYVLSQIPIDNLPRDQWHTLDPMCGHGIFLIATMRRMRELLPKSWGCKERHKFFVKHLHGIEIDSFSIEVARLCLMLADFPEPNGWDLKKQDVFSGTTLEDSVSKTMVLVGNPPFENIDNRTPITPKPVELLKRTLPNLPRNSFIGLVLPRAFLDGSDYKNERNILLKDFDILSITALPDKIFSYSDQETAIIIAKKYYMGNKSITYYREVRDSHREKFKSTYDVTWEDAVSQSYFTTKAKGQLVVSLFREIFEYLDGNARLGDIAKIQTGAAYNPRVLEKKEELILHTPAEGFVAGFYNVKDRFYQFEREYVEYINAKKLFIESDLSSRDWKQPKVILPRSPLSRGPWRYAAVIDKKGQIVGRRFFILWTTRHEISVDTLAAILNSPLAEAFVYSLCSKRDITKDIYLSIPIPNNLSAHSQLIDSLVSEYTENVLSNNKKRAKEILLRIDAEILKLYNLSPKMERKLLDLFWGYQRRVPFEFKGYISPNISSWIPLNLYISQQFNNTTPEKIMARIPIIRDAQFIKYLKELGREK
jgi:hypothetical protein